MIASMIFLFINLSRRQRTPSDTFFERHERVYVERDYSYLWTTNRSHIPNYKYMY
jgi:hypothetical protein